MPPAVALLNYIRGGILWRSFCQTANWDISRGFLFTYDLSLISPFMYVPLPSACLDSEISGILFVRVPRSSFRVRHSTVQRSSEGCSVAQKGAA